MKKLITFLLAFMLIASCRKTDQIQLNSELNIVSVVYPSLGDQSRIPDLVIPVDETDWNGDSSFHVGIAANNPTIRIRNGKVYLHYVCPIANIAQQLWSDLYKDYSGGDLVIDRAREGVWDSTINQWTFPGMIDIRYYIHGRKFSYYNKVEYNVGNGYYKNDFDESKERHYGWPDTMYISGRSADVYGNDVEIPATNFVPNTGYGVVRVFINPYKRILESNYDNNISLLPVRILPNGIAIVDYNAIADNQPAPVDNFSGQYFGNGRDKRIVLNWNPLGEETKLLRDGNLLQDEIYDSTYTLSVPANFKQSTFTIIKVIDGLGESNPVSITVKK